MANENMMNLLYENMNAIMKSSQAWSESFTELSKTFASMAQAHMEANLSVMKALTNSKSMQEVLNIQTDYAKKTADSAISDSKKIVDSTDKMAHENIASMKADGKADGAAANAKQKYA